MLIKRPLFPRFLPLSASQPTCIFCAHRRQLHARIPIPPVPSPTPFVPDTETFLRLIGRDLSQHASKFPSWESLFTFTSPQLRALGIEPARTRRYLLRWREKFRNGEYGPGGNLQKVKDGIAEFALMEVPVGEATNSWKGPEATATSSPWTRKIIANVDEGASFTGASMTDVRRDERLKIVRGQKILGPYVQFVKGTGGKRAMMKVTERMWEHRRGQKVDGGERRKAMVRAKRRSAERKAQAG